MGKVKYRGIELKNIFYMLTYAVDELKHLNHDKADLEGFQSSIDILAYLLIESHKILVKHGGIRGSSTITKDTSKPHGKIDYVKSLLNSNGGKTSLVCTYEEVSKDSTINQIILCAINLLLKSHKHTPMQTKYHKKLLKIKSSLQGVQNRNFTMRDLEFEKRNKILPRHIKPILFSSIIIIENLSYSDEKSNKQLYRLHDEARLKYIFEKFVRNYYKSQSKKLNLTYVTKHKFEKGNYQADCLIGTGDNYYIVLDCKWYENSSKSSSNVGQISLYIQKAREDMESKISKLEDAKVKNRVKVGIILYAQSNKISNTLEKETAYDQSIYTITLNMNQDFSNICTDLFEIYTKVFEKEYYALKIT